MIAKVAIDLALDRLFTYEVPVDLLERVRVGQLLRVPFNRREARGFAIAVEDAAASSADLPYTLKPILGIADDAPFFSLAMLKLVKWISTYTCSPFELCLKAAVPAAVLKPNAKPKERLYVEAGKPAGSVKLTAYQSGLLANIERVGGGWMQQVCREFGTTPATLRTLEKKGVLKIEQHAQRRDPLAGRSVVATSPLALNDMQKKALDTILGGSGADAEGKAPKPVLLHGVTGSGKTEVYLQAIAHELSEGRGAIVLVPEISLTPQTVRRFAGRFGGKVAVLHSALSDGERYDEWHRIRTGEARVVVGPRSAVFAPVANLGLIVVDEEHDTSYKQDETPRYNARDVAVMRGFHERCKVVLGSATPSLESWLNAKTGKYALASMAARVAGHPMPSVHLLNMEEECEAYGTAPIFSKFLLDAIAERMKRGEQTILFLNRRGYSRIYECKGCGHVMGCPDCSVSYTYHKADNCLRCHICGGWIPLPQTCPECGAREFSCTGAGTQRAEQALGKCFPQARILRMDADSTSRKNSHDDILSKFRAREADVLIGTQMIAKGLDFPNVTLVGILNADASLHMPDFRAGERTFQLIAQVSGRAGRAEKPGEVFIQTFHPGDPTIVAAADADFIRFAEAELKERKEAGYPPFRKFAAIVFKSKDSAQAQRWSELYSKSLEKFPGLVASEAMPSAIEKMDGWYRYVVQLFAAEARIIALAWKWITEARPVPKEMRASIDIDAITVM